MHPSAIFVPPIPIKGVMGDGGHRTQPRERAPEPVTSAQMCSVQSPRLATVEALSQIMRIPQVEVADLRALDADNLEDVSRRHLECLGLPRRHPELGNFGQRSAHLSVKRSIERWQLLEYVSTGGALRRATASGGGVVYLGCVMLSIPQSGQRHGQNTASLARSLAFDA